MTPKLGRNAPCWCGSGVKYKKCHLNREQQDTPNIWEVFKNQRKAFTSTCCHAPKAWQHECTGTIVKAHTVPKSSSLARIARDSHVYSYLPGRSDFIKPDSPPDPGLLGINKASTFTGFCSRHDDSIFSPIEKHEFVPTKEQCALLAFRAFSREYYMKQSLVNVQPLLKIMDRGKTLPEQCMIQDMASSSLAGSSIALQDYHHRKILFDSVITDKKFSDFNSYIIEFDIPQPVMCSGVFCPNVDYAGRLFQDLSDETTVPQAIYMTSFFGGKYGATVFTWHTGGDSLIRPFVEQLDHLSDEFIAGAVTWLMFDSFENLFIQPSWWEGLTKSQRKMLNRTMADSAIPWNVSAARRISDGKTLRINAWPVVARKWINSTTPD